jgi:predicted O-methyltransferase YrrM
MFVYTPDMPLATETFRKAGVDDIVSIVSGDARDLGGRIRAVTRAGRHNTGGPE